ncbi:hypothetical protein TWF506_009919 [Arthrobotrys conoides]|uniref:Uncharacterized protein n=1 Tax=Arthrobotrys conoides TaxID=74498 RepID=A0AAN8RWH1_9PEZI
MEIEQSQTREEILKVIQAFVNPNSISIEEVADEYCKLLERVENGTDDDEDEDIDTDVVPSLVDITGEGKDYTTSEINELFRPTQDVIIDALENDKPLSPEVEEMIAQVQIRKNKELELEQNGTSMTEVKVKNPDTEEEEERTEVYSQEAIAKPTSTSIGLRAGRAPFFIPAPLIPDFDAAFSTLPLDIAATILFLFIQNRWEDNRVRLHGQTWYQLIRILRAADVHAAFKSIGRLRRLTLPVTSPLSRLEVWALSNKNYFVARGVAYLNQGLANSRTVLNISRLCRTLMDPTGANVACPFCGMNNPNGALHFHFELRLIAKLFFQSQFRYVEPIVLWDARTPEATAIFRSFKQWVYQWKREVVRLETRARSNRITKTIGLAQGARARVSNRVIQRWFFNKTATDHWLDGNKALINQNWNTFRNSMDIYMGFPISRPGRNGRTISCRRLDLWPGEDAFERLIDDELVRVLGTVPSLAANQSNMGIRGRRLQLPYENLRTTVLPAAELPPPNATWGHAYRTEEKWHHFYSNYPLDPNAGSSLAG